MDFLHFMAKHSHHENSKFRKHEIVFLFFRAFVIKISFLVPAWPGQYLFIEIKSCLRRIYASPRWFCLGHFNFGHSNLFRISSFGFRISGFTGLGIYILMDPKFENTLTAKADSGINSENQ